MERPILPRESFAENLEMFRRDDQGQRVADFNCCVHSAQALEIICENAVEIGKVLRPTTSRYFYWGDDGRPWCQCPKCRELSPSEQVFLADVEAYRKRGIRHVTTFAAWVDADYQERCGDLSFIQDYGQGLMSR